MRKYAIDLTTQDKIIDKRTERIIIIDWIEETLDKDSIHVLGFFEDDGTDFERTLDADATVRVA